MKFIAIRSLSKEPPYGALQPGESRYDSETGGGRAVDEDQETGMRYINPSLVLPLEKLWLDSQPDGREDAVDVGGEGGVEAGAQIV